MSNVMTFAFRLAWALTLFGGLGEATIDFMKMAEQAHSKGLISFKQLNSSLQYNAGRK